MRSKSSLILVTLFVYSTFDATDGQCTKPTLTEGLQWSSTEPSGDIPTGDTVTFECASGYTISGSASVTCTLQTLGAMPTCTPDDCTNPGDAPTNGQKTGTDYTHGSTVTYTCNDGYTLSGPGVLTCTAGSWDNPVPTCKADCTDPGAAPANGTKTGDDYTHGATVTYACDEGFTLSGPGTLTCNDGSWDNAVPTCSAGIDTTTETPDPGESGGGVRMPSLLVTLMSIIIMTLLTY